MLSLLRASCLPLKIKECRCYEAKIEESEKVGSHLESNLGHLWLAVLCHWPTLTILYMYCMTILYMYCTRAVSWVDSWWLPPFFTFLHFHLITSTFLLWCLILVCKHAVVVAGDTSNWGGVNDGCVCKHVEFRGSKFPSLRLIASI